MAFLDDNGLLYFWQRVKVLLSNKVDAESGKGLSTEDFTTEEKEQLAALGLIVGDEPVSDQIHTAVAQKSQVQLIVWGADE